MAVSVPGIEFADAADGSGGTLTISDSTAGSTNTFYLQSLDSTWYANQGWVAQGSRVGDGTLAVSCPAGQYFGYVVSVSGADSNASVPLMFRATETADAIYYQILQAAQIRIRLLQLQDVVDSSVLAWKMPLLRAISALTSPATGKKATYPVVLLTTMDAETNNPQAGTNYRDEIVYSVAVAIVSELETRPEYDQLETNHNRNLLHIERIRKAFLNQRLPGAATVIRCYVESRGQITGLIGDNLEGYGMVLRFVSRETRGLT